MDYQIIELYLLKTLPLRAGLEEVMERHSSRNSRSDLDVASDKIAKRYLDQIDFDVLKSAEKMSEFYRIFFALENDIRRFISSALDAAYEEDWWDDHAPQVVKENVKKNQDREASEGIPPRSDYQIDYTTFGELGEIIKENWDVFQGVFSNASKGRVLRVINRLNLARGPVAHCNAIPTEEAVRLKLTMRDWFSLME